MGCIGSDYMNDGNISSSILRFLTGDFICKLPCGEWIYPSTAELMKKVGLELIQTYINERKKTRRETFDRQE